MKLFASFHLCFWLVCSVSAQGTIGSLIYQTARFGGKAVPIFDVFALWVRTVPFQGKGEGAPVLPRLVWATVLLLLYGRAVRGLLRPAWVATQRFDKPGLCTTIPAHATSHDPAPHPGSPAGAGQPSAS